MAFKKLKLWFDKDLAILLAKKIILIEPQFNSKRFIKKIDKEVQSLELKDRVEVIADQLFIELGDDYKKTVDVLIQTLGPENEEETGMFTNFYWIMPFAKLVEKYGLDDFNLSMKAIKEITKRNTGEYTIRPYLEHKNKQTLKVMLKWAKDKNRHVRRLASEGVRPRLPWAKKLDIYIDDPSPIIPILSLLKDDSSKYVQKSVANCLNDILKDNFEIGKQIIEEWNIDNCSKERKWIIKHALRNFIKKEEQWALKIIGKS